MGVFKPEYVFLDIIIEIMVVKLIVDLVRRIEANQE